MNKYRIRIDIRTKTQKYFMKEITKKNGTDNQKEKRNHHENIRIYYYFIKKKRKRKVRSRNKSLNNLSDRINCRKCSSLNGKDICDRFGIIIRYLYLF